MTPHPVSLRVEPSPHPERIHVLIRLVLLAAVGTVGWSSLYWLLFLALAAGAALYLSQKGPRRYLSEDAPKLVRALRWTAAAYAYLWLLTDGFPTEDTKDQIDLQIALSGTPTTSSALLRLVTSLPAFFVLALLSIAAGVLWVVGAVWILLVRRLPSVIAEFLSLTLLFQFRLAAYHLSLVDRYPSFDAPVAHVPREGMV